MHNLQKEMLKIAEPLAPAEQEGGDFRWRLLLPRLSVELLPIESDPWTTHMVVKGPSFVPALFPFRRQRDNLEEWLGLFQYPKH
ncbi:MAG: hypothetical protein ABIK79_02900 [Chloroflexota bacterium]|nr:hypothetical protein [Anaerolineae bacterium]